MLPAVIQQAHNQYRGEMVFVHAHENKALSPHGWTERISLIPQKENVFQFKVNFARNFGERPSVEPCRAPC